MNGGISIHTYFLEEYIKGNIHLHIMKPSAFPEKSLEMELLTHGYSSMQNKLKQYLLARQKKENANASGEKVNLPEVSKEYAYQIILKTKEMCVMRANVEDNEEVSTIIEKFIADDFEEGTTKKVYFYPRMDDSNDLMKTVIHTVGKELYEDPQMNDSRQRYIRRLLTEKAHKQSNIRRNLIKAAYRLGMSVKEMNLFLTKAAFTYELDFTDVWEMKAAYMAEHKPAEAGDSPMMFLANMEKLKQEDVESFLVEVRQATLNRWLQECHKLRDEKSRLDFLMQWTWKLFCYMEHLKSLTEEAYPQTEKELSDIYGKIKKIIQSQNLQEEEVIFRELFIDCLLDRHFQLLQFLYQIASSPKETVEGFRVDTRDGNTVGICVPVRREDGFIHLNRNLKKIENPDRVISRSDILLLGIALGMTWEELDHALEIAGFYKLYAKDFHERALINRLQKERLLFDSSKGERVVLDIEALLGELESLYHEVSIPLREQMKKREPEWIRNLRKNE